MRTQTKENYLKSIYFLNQKSEDISITELGKSLNVSTPTVNNMVKKLQVKGWVIYEKYKPLKLTEKGKTEAALIVRKHRLVEMFLFKIMGFGWEEVHDIAEEMEHLKSGILFDRMDELLGFPTVDPHGSPIPDKSGKSTHRNYLNLSDVEEGKAVRLCALTNSTKELLLFLNKKKIRLGTEMAIQQVEAFDKSIVIDYDHFTSIGLSYEVCKCLLVEEI